MHRKPHVAMLVPSFATSGEVDIPAIRLLVEHLAREVRLSVVPVRYPPVAGFESWHGADIHIPGGGDAPFRKLLLRTVSRLRREHARSRIDVLHAWWLFEPGFIAVAAGKILGIPVVSSIGGAELACLPEIDYGGARTRRGRFIARRVLAESAVITGGSSYVLDQARDFGALESQLARLPLPVDTGLFRPSDTCADAPSSGQHLLHVGAFLPVKDQITLVRAFAAIQHENSDVRLTMIGEDPVGYRAQVETIVRELGMWERVRLKSRIPHQELVAELQSADLFVFPSRHESQGLAPLEALACGVPTVGSDIGVLRDLAPEFVKTVRPGNVEELARTCADLLRILEGARSRALAGADHVRREYGPDTVTRRLLPIYRSIQPME